MNYIAPRKMTVASVSGRSVHLAKGVPTYCPPQMHAELIAVGCVPETEMEEPVVVGPVEPTTTMDREAAMFAAFEKILLRNKREEFNAVGIPHSAVVSKELGWRIENKERDVAWKQFNLEKAET